MAEKLVKVTAAILSKEGSLLIAMRPAGTTLENKWELPGGKIDRGESPEDCLKREMKEEFDIDVTVGELLASSVYHYNHISIELLAYRTNWNSGEISMSAHDDCRWAPPSELGAYDFAPADIPIIDKIRRGDIEV